MQHVTRASVRGVLASLCAWVLLLQATALPIVHLLHWSETVKIAGGEKAAATCCPHGHGGGIESAGDASPAHDSKACPTCALLAQHRGAGVTAPGTRPAPAPQVARLVTDVRRLVARAPRVVAGPRAPPLLCA